MSKAVEYYAWLKNLAQNKEVRKTSDDTFTPPEAYDDFLECVHNLIDIDDSKIVRPFYPDGDYQKYSYKPDDIVVDNPPFSKLSEIVRFYEERNIKYFLMAPALTLFNIAHGEATCYVVRNKDVIFDNGVKIKIAYVTNMLKDKVVMYKEPKPKPKSKRKGAELTKYESSAALLLKSCRIPSGVEIVKLHPKRYITKDKNGKQIFGGAFEFEEEVNNGD